MERRRLKDLLKDVGQYNLKGQLEKNVSGLYIDSRNVESNGLFAALKGNMSDGHDFINQAINNGAHIILCQDLPERLNEDVTYVQVDNTRKVIGFIAHEFYNRPTEKLKCVGVTGTNGKTTIVTLLYNLFKELGFKVGLISTVEILVNEKREKTSLTTPDVIHLHQLMSLMIEEDCSHVFMEVSSHAVDQFRIAGIQFEGGVFSNITHDHLDYHGDFSSYIQAKRKFFTGLDASSFALVNVDDKNAGVMLENCSAQQFSYSLRTLTDYKGKILNEDAIGMQLEINNHVFFSMLNGRFNASNLTAVYGTADLLENIDSDILIEKMSALKFVKGRMEVLSLSPRIIVDYAHTPDALMNILDAINSTIDEGKLITVVGCGGDRDKKKRPVMGRISSTRSHVSIFTADNPRGEKVRDIIDHMKSGVPQEALDQVVVIEDRELAIKVALKMASKKDTVLIAGKGHEEYQEVNGVRSFFSDQQIVKDILSKHI